MARITGASTLEQQLYDHVSNHGKNEGQVLSSYQELAETTDSPAVAYLARLILDDEQRHHQMLDDLAETIRTTAELSGEPTPIPPLDPIHGDRDRILAQTEEFLHLEEEDNRELARLAKELSDVRNTTLWELVVRIMQQDNEKHRRILEFIRDRVREH